MRNRSSTQSTAGLALVAAWAFLAACTSPATPATLPPTTSPPATATTRPATTTTVPDFHLDGADPAWEQVVADFYGPVCGGNRSSVLVELASWPTATDCPIGGRAAMSSVGEV